MIQAIFARFGGPISGRINSSRTAAAIALSLGILAAGFSLAPATAARASTQRVADVVLPGSCLYAGEFMRPGDHLDAPAQKVGIDSFIPFQLVMQTDGNLVEYNSAGQPLWDSETSGHPGAYAALQASDGNLVVYPQVGGYLWSAFVPKSPGDRLCIQDDGNLVVYSAWPVNAPLWATMTLASTGIYAPPGQTLSYNPTFQNGQCTDWAERQFRAWTGTYIDTLGVNGRSGNALDWAYNAYHRHWTVGTTPRIGSIVVFQPRTGLISQYGHVAWVTEVYPSQNAIEITEWNNPLPYHTDSRMISLAGWPGLQYIYANP
jgi:surface antigen